MPPLPTNIKATIINELKKHNIPLQAWGENTRDLNCILNYISPAVHMSIRRDDYDNGVLFTYESERGEFNAIDWADDSACSSESYDELADTLIYYLDYARSANTNALIPESISVVQSAQMA